MANKPPKKIHDLSPEILFYIFALNTNHDKATDSDDEYSSRFDGRATPLDDTLAASQVCRRWRNILKVSDALWGRLLDTSFFKRKSHRLWDEVVARSGRSALWLSCDNRSLLSNSGDDEVVGQYVLPLLYMHDKRIRMHKIKLDLHLNDKNAADKRWKALLDLPTIRHLELSFSTLPLQLSPGPRYNNPQLPMHNLETLCLLQGGFRGRELIEVLQQAPRLRRLELGGGRVDSTANIPRRNIINLPHLEQVTFNDMMDDTLWIFPRILSASTWKLRMQSKRMPHPRRCTPQNMRLFTNAIVQYMKGHFSRTPSSRACVQRLVLVCGPRQLGLVYAVEPRKQRRDREDIDWTAHFDFLVGENQEIPTAITNAVLKPLLDMTAPELKELMVIWKYSPNAPNVSDPFKTKFFVSLRSLEYLITNRAFLQVLQLTGRSVSLVIFPALTKLKYEVTNPYEDQEDEAQDLDLFLQWRQALKAPIGHLIFEASHSSALTAKFEPRFRHRDLERVEIRGLN